MKFIADENIPLKVVERLKKEKIKEFKGKLGVVREDKIREARIG